MVSHVPRIHDGTTFSNWAGYDLTGTGATDIVGTWVVPQVSCSAGENSWSSPWIGIDGYASATLEQTGIDAYCVKGTATYTAWYEMYPHNSVYLGMAVHPGDTMTGEVSSMGGGTFVLSIQNVTTGDSFQTTQVSKKAQDSSVEWVVEGPSNQALSDFRAVSFSGARATIDGVTRNLGAFPSPDAITMAARGVTRAIPSSLSGGNGPTSFTVTWTHS
jgi:hypothetical protein